MLSLQVVSNEQIPALDKDKTNNAEACCCNTFANVADSSCREMFATNMLLIRESCGQQETSSMLMAWFCTNMLYGLVETVRDNKFEHDCYDSTTAMDSSISEMC